ncbi:MAG: NAD(+) synthase [Clostridiales bacterium]
MLIGLAQIKIYPSQPDKNYQTMLQYIEKAQKQGLSLLIFPQMSLSGLWPGDNLQNSFFIEDCLAYGESIAKESGSMGIIFGNIDSHGQDCCYLAQNGFLQSLPALSCSAGSFAEDACQSFSLFLAGQKYQAACLLGDWRGRELPAICDNVDFIINPAQINLNLAAPYPLAALPESPKPYIFLNGCGGAFLAKNYYLFSGGSGIVLPDIGISCEAALLREDLLIIDDWQGFKSPRLDEKGLLWAGLLAGVKSFTHAIGAKRAVMGLSGGIDSAVAACIYQAALGKDNLLLCNMPSRFNSDTTKNLSASLAEALGTPYMVIPIEASVELTLEQFASIPYQQNGRQGFLQPGNLAKENLQARDRSARVLATAAAAWQGIFTCNSNKIEATVGYGTFYGDLAGAFAALGDLWKRQVYLAGEEAGEMIPEAKAALQAIASIYPSAELSLEQAVDQGKGDPLIYAYHDYLFQSWVEKNWTGEETLFYYQKGLLEDKIGCQKGLLRSIFADDLSFVQDMEYWWKMYKGIAVAKRLQVPPVLVLSAYPLTEKKENQGNLYFSQHYQQLKADILGR